MLQKERRAYTFAFSRIQQKAKLMTALCHETKQTNTSKPKAPK
jgi:hypothetical protein